MKMPDHLCCAQSFGETNLWMRWRYGIKIAAVSIINNGTATTNRKKIANGNVIDENRLFGSYLTLFSNNTQLAHKSQIIVFVIHVFLVFIALEFHAYTFWAGQMYVCVWRPMIVEIVCQFSKCVLLLLNFAIVVVEIWLFSNLNSLFYSSTWQNSYFL